MVVAVVRRQEHRFAFRVVSRNMTDDAGKTLHRVHFLNVSHGFELARAEFTVASASGEACERCWLGCPGLELLIDNKNCSIHEEKTIAGYSITINTSGAYKHMYNGYPLEKLEDAL